MNAGIRFLKVDLIVQRIILGVYFTVGLLGMIVHSFLFLALLMQIVIGIWQVISAFVLTLSGNKRRVTYLLAVVSFFILLACGVALVSNRAIPESVFLFIVGLVIVPMVFAIWYYVITQIHYNEAILNPSQNEDLKIEMEDILDSEELY